jgi:hypothetical protein
MFHLWDVGAEKDLRRNYSTISSLLMSSKDGREQHYEDTMLLVEPSKDATIFL